MRPGLDESMGINIRNDKDLEVAAHAQKAFIFLYPQQDIIDWEVKKSDRYYMRKYKELHGDEGHKDYRELYGHVLNACIDTRYRQEGFTIFFALLDETQVSDLIDVYPDDKVIYVGMDAQTHRTKNQDGEYSYPDQDHILKQLGEISTLRVGGFHLHDCVEKLARRAYERGLDVLVDEDLTEIFPMRMVDHNFKVDRYPTFDPYELLKMDGSISFFKMFMDGRSECPWLYQYDYRELYRHIPDSKEKDKDKVGV
jgi:hypothetical protein